MPSDKKSFESLKKRRTKNRLLRRMFFMIILFICFFSAYFCYRNDYYSKFVDNINDISKVLKKGAGYPIELSAVSINDKKKIGNEVLILDEDIIYTFNRFGYKMMYEKHGLTNPRVATNNNKFVIFEHLGKNFQVYSKTTKIYEAKQDDIIYDLTLSSDGKIAIIQGSSRYVSTLEILGTNYKRIFKWNCADKYISGVAFDSSNKNMVVSSLFVRGADYVSSVDFFNINRDEKLASIEITDDVIISIKYKNNKAYIVGEKNAYVVDNKGEIKYKYSYEGKALKAYYDGLKRDIILVFDNYGRIDNNEVVVLNDELIQKGVNKITGAIKDVTGEGNKFYILSEDDISMFNLNAERIGTYKVDSSISDILSAGNKLYKINTYRLNIVER